MEYAKGALVNWTKPFRLRGGNEVKIFDGTGDVERPVIGAYRNGDNWIPCSWSITGLYRDDGKFCGLDIVNEDSKF
jgi:hypothetical protein